MNKAIFIIITTLFALPAFLLARIIWPFPQTPTSGLITFFTLTTAIESIFTGIGISFVFLVLTKYITVLNKHGILGWLSFVSIAWILISGYPHDNSHIAQGTELHGLVPIEIFFHGTLAIAALIVMKYFLKSLKSKNKF